MRYVHEQDSHGIKNKNNLIDYHDNKNIRIPHGKKNIFVTFSSRKTTFNRKKSVFFTMKEN